MRVGQLEIHGKILKTMLSMRLRQKKSGDTLKIRAANCCVVVVMIKIAIQKGNNMLTSSGKKASRNDARRSPWRIVAWTDGVRYWHAGCIHPDVHDEKMRVLLACDKISRSHVCAVCERGLRVIK